VYSHSCIIISVGTEIVNGTIQDKHLKYLAQKLGLYGFRIRKAVQVPDDIDTIRGELSGAVSSAELVILTGGLGPTSDDITRNAVASVAGVELKLDEAAWNKIQERLKGRNIARVNMVQAMFPKGFKGLDNPLGTAPGFAGRIGNSLVVTLPGPPRELDAVFNVGVVPLLETSFKISVTEGDTFGCSIFMTPESRLEEALRNCRVGRVVWGTRVTPYSIELYLRGGSPNERRKLFFCIEKKLGRIKVREGYVTPHSLLFKTLKEKGKSLVTVESCTGGLVGKLITDIPGSSNIFWGGFIVYSNKAKETSIGVDKELLDRHGAVSEEAVRAMARGALARARGSNVAIAISGIAGPEGGTPEKPVGTVFIAVAQDNGKTDTRLFHFHGDRERIRRKAAITGLLFAENSILGGQWLDSDDRW